MSNFLSFVDQRYKEAAIKIDTGNIKLLLVDIFDTYIYRTVPMPYDVFLRMGKLLKDQGKLLNNQEPDSFAALRYQTELEARNRREASCGDREVSIEEIYDLFPSGIVDVLKDQLIELELQVEKAFTRLNQDAKKLLSLAKDKGLKVAFVSNMYLSQKQITDILVSADPDVPEVDGFFVSSDHRMRKQNGLLLKACHHFSISPAQAMLIGDNPISDKGAAEKDGIAYIDITFDQDIEKLLATEHPRQWHKRTNLFSSVDGDYCLTELRRKAKYRGDLDQFASYGYSVMGPVLTGFAAWLTQSLKSKAISKTYALLREGDFLSRLISEVSDAKLAPKELAVSRISTFLAIFHPDYPEHLVDFFTRRGHWTTAMLLGQLGFSEDDVRAIIDPSVTLDEITPDELANALSRSPLIDVLYKKSADRRGNLMKYLRSIGALDDDKLYLIDLGYAATIQKNLQRVFNIEGINIVTHGLYLITAHVSRGTQWEGGIAEGFLAQNGNPNDFASAICRSPEVIELSCMPDYGSVIGYQDDGAPLFDDRTVSSKQATEIESVQKGVLAFASDFTERNKSANFMSPQFRLQIQRAALRAVVYPTKTEAQLVGHWEIDTEMGLTDVRPIVPSQKIPEVSKLSGDAFSNLSRREVPWLYGLASLIDKKLLDDVIKQKMRRDCF